MPGTPAPSYKGRLDKKYKNAAKELAWQWVFPDLTLTTVRNTGEKKRYHIHESHVQRAIRDAVRKAKLYKCVTAHTFRHSFASHLIMKGATIKDVQELLGHKDLKMTMRYSHLSQEHKAKAVNLLNGLTGDKNLSENCQIFEEKKKVFANG